jgi:hypothetical protein
MHRQRNLLEIVLALHPPSRFAGELHRGKQESHQHADDGDNDE